MELQRGASVLACDGEVVGSVAAVVLDCHTHAVTHLLLGNVPPTAIYRLIPINSIVGVAEEVVRLAISDGAIAELPIFQPD